MNLKRHHVLYTLLAVSVIIALLVFLTPGAQSLSYTTGKSGTLSVSSTSPLVSDPIQPMHFEVVTTDAAQERGLGGRTVIPENYGMLFVFAQDFNVGFWMKDMQVSIDIVWLSDNGTVLGIEDSISPNTYPNSVYPPKPVKYVLETKAGEMRRRGWEVGTKIPLPLPYGA
ncbi:MAG: hypothetical protein JWL75_392 [Parcubacteria group bacterium]|nr:hypothetical protein [Parcubacteria group bacterium]